MFTLVAVIILSMVSGVLFLTDAMWVTQSNTLDNAKKLLHLEVLATGVRMQAIKPTRGDEIVEREIYQKQFLAFSLAIVTFNAALDKPDWLAQRFFTDKTQDMRIRRFQSQSLQMVQSISLMMQAEKARDILSTKRKLTQQLQDSFFEDGELILATKQVQTATLHSRLGVFAWMVLPLLAIILSAIWVYMISPTIKSQERIYKDLKQSQKAALDMAEIAIQADIAKTQFLTVLSHELRTPLNGIIGLSEDLAVKTKNTENHASAQNVLTKGNELAVLVDEVISLTESQKTSQFDPDAFMQSVCEKQEKMRNSIPATIAYKIPNNCKILIADDNRTNRVVMDKLVKRMGCTADIVEDGEQAIIAFKTKGYDLLLLDISMPIKSGEEAIQAIRAYEKLENLTRAKALAVTANTLKAQIESYLNSGFDDCLAKPVNFKRLSGKIDLLLSI
jgi:CheY-like chemotaxis protein